MKPITLTRKSLNCTNVKDIKGKSALIFSDATNSTIYFIYINKLLSYTPDILLLETFLEDFKKEYFDILISEEDDAILDISSEATIVQYFENLKNEL